MKIGILGGGQLAMMLVNAGHALGLQFECFDPNPEACAQTVCSVVHAPYTDTVALSKFTADKTLLTFETENIPLTAYDCIAQSKPIYPSRQALAVSQDRYLEKQFLQSLDIPTAPWRIDGKVQYPAIMKTRTQGYDGKGQQALNGYEDYQRLKQKNTIVETRVAFTNEVSLISARTRHGKIKHYPLTQNHHQDGILSQAFAPFVDDSLYQQAIHYNEKLLSALDYVGVLCIEYFVVENKLIANEFAPRVHNSGHWTIEGCTTSQFQQHLLALTGLTLGDTQTTHAVHMQNFIGEIPPPDTLAGANTFIHLYHKTPQAGRKLGHMTQLLENNP